MAIFFLSAARTLESSHGRESHLTSLSRSSGSVHYFVPDSSELSLSVDSTAISFLLIAAFHLEEHGP